MHWDILICVTVIVGITLYFAISKIILWRETKTTDTTPEPETASPSTPPTAPVPTPTPTVSIRRRIEWEWWNNETWGPIILALVGLLLFWVCLQWFFPETTELTTNKKLWVGIGLILAIVCLVKPRWSAMIALGSLVVLLLLGEFNQLEKSGYVDSRPKTKVVTRNSNFPTLITVPVKKGEWTEVRVPCNKSLTQRVIPTTNTVIVKTSDGKTHIDGYGHENDYWGVTQGGNGAFQVWKVSTNDEGETHYIISWK